MDKKIELPLPEDARVIVVSDLHGELELFKSLLKKVDVGEEDYLIINGDLCEKGENSKGVVEFVMELEASHPHVYVIEGNCDTLVEDLLEENPKLMGYLHARKHTLIAEWLEEVGFVMDHATTVQEIKEILTRHYMDEINWLMELPTLIDTEDYVFVHAGIENREDWKETDRLAAITMPSFLDRSHQADKYVIVGHWPVVNYATHIPSNNPIVDHEKNIIAIDGGNVIKHTGQLNAFIIHRAATGDSFSYTYVDKYPEYEVKNDFEPDRQMNGSLTYPYYELKRIQEYEHFTLCEQPDTHKRLLVKNEYIKPGESEGFYGKTDVTCAQLSVKKGDLVKVVDSSCTGYDLVKKDGVEGWIEKGNLLRLNPYMKNTETMNV